MQWRERTYESEAVVDSEHHDVDWSGVIGNHYTPTLGPVLPVDTHTHTQMR